MNPDRHNLEEERYRELFALVNSDSAPPDPEFLDRLGKLSTEVFAAESAKQIHLSRRRRRMFVMAVRVVAAVAATIMVAFLYFLSPTSSDSGVLLGDVLEKAAAAETLHLEITREGNSSQIWTQGPRRLRWNEAEGHYKIAEGDKLWMVDEKANRAALRENHYLRADGKGIDLLALLELPKHQPLEDMLAERPVDRVTRDGRDCHVYRTVFSTVGPKIQIEALVDAGTQLLRSLEVRAERDGKWEPAGKLVVLGLNQPVDESLFVLGDTLTEDGRIGKVADVQGIVSVRPVLHSRWTPVSGNLVLKPGDWLRTDVRGANAALVRLVKQTSVTVGPASSVELISPKKIRVFSGELRVSAAAKAPVELEGPEQEKVVVKGKQIWRVQGGKLVRVKKDPLWLSGFDGATSNESIGSLIANVDGRNEPLTVGYHKVTVDVRDQIARTVIEESFVNHTDGVLEGVFYFPLPQDASISGFGMWIGNELVEADVVEKQRAREIYEIILREKRDPGLLEWTGGNLFKARVFPIFAHSEKRIKITYTQVLPLRGNSYRYSYGLQSEMLKQHPLRELGIILTVNSAAPLKNVTSPTHLTRTQKTRHSAQIEFAAQEYTPTADFEVVIELDGDRPDAVLIPHRRGEDGYFMLQVTPRTPGADQQREILPDGQPLDLLILADTSASMDADSRQVQEQFVAAVLASLGPEDKFNLACCDVQCDWAFKKPVATDSENVGTARKLLAERRSLGWTDLDEVFASALKQSGPKTQVVYVGDGIHATTDADPVAFSKRLRRISEGKNVPFHAVSVSSSFESVVLNTIASLGGGSVRQITGQRGPQAVAIELLGEIAKPGIRNLEVEFRGLRAARVYPEQLPNLPVGSQQIILGRYLPEGGDQTGEVIVTGIQDDKPIRFSAPVSLKDAQQGNSFIPRLWARMHLDSLLQQGVSDTVKDKIIGLSEEYHIITPYTSLLVLESDADRERFQVRRRFQMRDGQEFFAQGRQNANYELLQQQMRKAGLWRMDLRRAVLGQLAGLGRNREMFESSRYPDGIRGYASPAGGPVSNWDTSSLETGLQLGFASNGRFDSYWLGDRSSGLDVQHDLKPMDQESNLSDFDEDLGMLHESREKKAELSSLEVGLEMPMDGLASAASGPFFGAFNARESSAKAKAYGDFFGGDLSFDGRSSRRARGLSLQQSRSFYSYQPSRPAQPNRQYTAWLDKLFPALPSSPGDDAIRPEERWPARARALSERLLRIEQPAALEGGLQISRRSETFDVRSGDLNSVSHSLSFVSPQAWLIAAGGGATQTTVQWCDAKERGIFSEAFQLGRLRSSATSDIAKPPLGLSGYVQSSLERTYRSYSVELKPGSDEQVLLVLQHPTSASHQTHVLIDSQRNVILKIENRQDGRVTSASEFGDFVEVLGSWWAGRIESTNDKGRRTTLITQQFKPLSAEGLGRQIDRRLAARDEIQFMRQPLEKVADAKGALAEGKPSFERHLVLLLHFAESQQWDRVMEHLGQLEQLSEGKPGMRWVRNELLNVSRRREELKKRILDEATRLAGPAPDGSDSRQYFLAEYLVNQAGSFLPPIEMLPLLDSLQPLYQRQPAHLQATKGWQRRRADYLEGANRGEEAFMLRKQLAEAYPHDYSLQQRYAQALIARGEHAAAFKWIDRALAGGFEWLAHEEESMRNVCTQALRSQGIYSELVEYLTKWVSQNPEGISAYQQYLSALVKADQIEQANDLIQKWMEEGQAPGTLPQGVSSRLSAAVAQALGQGYDLYTNRMDERWLKPLAEIVLFFARRESQVYSADRIMNHHQFRQSDECRAVRKTITKLLLAEIDELKADQIQRYVNWIMPNDPVVEAEVWGRIAAGIQRRWTAQSDLQLKHQLSRPLIQILSSRLAAEEYLAFLRLQLKEGPEENRASYASELFNALIGQPWSAEYESEAFSLLERLSNSEEPGQRLFTQVEALHRLTDSMIKARFDARMRQVEHQERLTRTELAAKKAENLRLAREAFAKRLRQAASEHSPALAEWMTVERLYFEVILGDNLEAVQDACWEFLGAEPTASGEVEPEQQAQWQLGEALRNRYLVTMLNLAARRSAKAASVNRALVYLDKGISLDSKDPPWKLLKYLLLVALDRPEDLEKSLGSWVRSDDPDNRWRLALGYLLAEQGRLAEAIELFEAVEADDELGPNDYRALAGWYMVVDRRQLHRRAIISSYKSMDEWRLSNWISAKLNPWQRNDQNLPGELDEEVMLVFAALFEKSGHPQNYLWQLREFYRATRDFRLLACLADGVIGHSAAKVYPFLQGMSSVLSEIRDEATADSAVKQIAQVRRRAETDVDRRAADLLEVQIERRSAELLNQPGPHVDAAVAALKRAFNQQWAEGEPRLMADFLAGLGAISEKKLADEQIRQLELLHQRGTPGSADRLHIAHSLANGYYNYARHEEAIDVLEAALGEFEQANHGILPQEANSPLSTFVDFLARQGYHARGENVLFKQLEHPVNRQQSIWLTERLYQHYEHAIGHDGDVSLGAGLALYQAVNRKLQDALSTDDNNHRYALINRLSSIYRTAHQMKRPGVVDDLEAFAFGRLAEVLRRQTNNYQSCVQQVADTLHDLAGARTGLAFLIERIENEPKWLRYNHQDGWSSHGWNLARWRTEAKELGDLEERLLAIVKDELRWDLRSRQSRNRQMYHRHHGNFWSENTDAFAQTAEEVLAERKDSGAAVQYIADYLYHGLDRHPRAIEILFSAHSRKILNEQGQSTLVKFLHEQNRYGESIAILQPLVELRPDNMQYRAWLMHAYFRTGRQEELLALLEDTDKYFHQENRWQEAAMASLGASCLENELFEQSVTYYKELIPLHQRTQPNRGIGNGTLTKYYENMARAYAGLQNTAQAVDAAGGAIISWGPRHERRADALRSLNDVLRQSPDLDAYVEHLDRQTAETGLDNPIVRKAIGEVYSEKGAYDKAIVQLRAACEIQPNDSQTHTALIACYDKQNDKQGAIRQTLESLRLSRRDINRYRDLGDRLKALERFEEAERAYTSIVEVLPNESESHTLLADLRQQQDRWDEAVLHWEQVAQIRSLEPTGLLKLAAAQIHQEQWDAAAETLKKLESRGWPSRFGDVDGQIRNLKQQIKR